MIGHRIDSSVAPGMAAQQSACRQIAAGTCPMSLQSTERIGRTRRLEAARRPEPGLQCPAIQVHHGHQHPTRQPLQAVEHADGGRLVHGDQRHARCISASSSSRAVLRRVTEAAERNRRRSKAQRRRTNQRPCSNVGSQARATDRIWRRIRLRVVASRACRFGTAMPSQHRSAGALMDSSTACGQELGVSVDNSTGLPALAAALGDVGHPGRW